MLSTPSHDALTLHYQPMAECGGHVVGLEALMRWHHRQRGAISPEAFIPIFEACGQIVSLSRWALRQACADAVSWDGGLKLAVNLSPVQFVEEDLPALVSAVLSETGLLADRLELEMTEAALVADPVGALETLKRLRALGVGLALDDFGKGKSAPSFFRDFPFTKVKIDDSLVHSLVTSVVARSVARMTIELAHSLGQTVVAEGVETQAQLDVLTSEGCDLFQGFLIGRPAAIENYAAFTGNRAALKTDLSIAATDGFRPDDPGFLPVTFDQISLGR